MNKMIPKPSTSAMSWEQVKALEAYEREHSPDTFDHKFNIGDIVWIYDIATGEDGCSYPFISLGRVTRIVKGIYGYNDQPGYVIEGELWVKEDHLFDNSDEPMRLLQDSWQKEWRGL